VIQLSAVCTNEGRVGIVVARDVIAVTSSRLLIVTQGTRVEFLIAPRYTHREASAASWPDDATDYRQPAGTSTVIDCETHWYSWSSLD